MAKKAKRTEAKVAAAASENGFEAMLEKYFGLKEQGTDIRTEFIAGLTTFLTMVYIVFVNPAILSKTGMDQGAVFVATCVAAAVSTMVMALYANYPIALAPGMGINAFFAFTVVLAYKYTWQQALAAVFCSGVLFFLISVFRIRQYVIESIPQNLKLAVSAGVGLFLGIIALEEAKIVVAQSGDAGHARRPEQPGGRAGAARFRADRRAQLSPNHRRHADRHPRGHRHRHPARPGALFSGIVSLPPSIKPTLLQLDFSRVFEGTFLIVVFSILFIDVFDNAGTLIGVTHRTGLMKRRQAGAHEGGADRRLLRRHVRRG